eukprot:jgi/Undpi1/12639/HiC_scaffold_6.g02307.m1
MNANDAEQQGEVTGVTECGAEWFDHSLIPPPLPPPSAAAAGLSPAVSYTQAAVEEGSRKLSAADTASMAAAGIKGRERDQMKGHEKEGEEVEPKPEEQGPGQAPKPQLESAPKAETEVEVDTKIENADNDNDNVDGEPNSEGENDDGDNDNGYGSDGESLLAASSALLRELERDLDAARVLLPECHRFRKVVSCVAEAIVSDMRVHPRQVMDVTEALREATNFTRSLSSPEAFLVVMAELLADGFEVITVK